MIQFKRGKSSSWRDQKKPLADGQPGYDKERHKLKIGDGKSSWDELPDASGLRLDEILDSEESAKKKTKAKAALNPLGNLIAKVFNLEDRPIITYGSEAPDDDTVGQIYLQHYDAEPEVDYVISAGSTASGWSFQKWKSGITRCSRTLTISTPVQSALGSGSLYQNNYALECLSYPVTFKEVPSETATIQSPGGLVWLATAKNGMNSTTKTASYNILSPDKLSNATYKISIQVEGRS